VLYRCYRCNTYCLEQQCPTCGEKGQDEYIPLDPKYLPEFRYMTQGLVKDLLFKRRKQEQLDQKLASVLEKYLDFKHPYFVNYLHIARGTLNTPADSSADEFTYSRLTLFHHVLTRLGFDELNEFPALTKRLVMCTQFDFDYSNFVSQVKNQIKDSLTKSLYAWIGVRGALFRRELPLFIHYLWERGDFTDVLGFNEPESGKDLVPLVSQSTLIRLRKQCEEIYLDIQITRFKALLEGFSPQHYLNIYAVDSMSGYDFEGFLTKLFSCLGYEVQETRKSQDQGADLFVKRFDKTIVVQAKNYTENVGNAAVQQALAARAFYGCDEAMVVTNSYFTPSAKELATATMSSW
jgi:restriction system protein